MKKVLMTIICAVIALQISVLPCGVHAETQESSLQKFTNLQISNCINEIYTANIEQIQNRTAGSIGEKSMANILAGKIDELGLQKLPGQESFLQEFEFSKSMRSNNVVGVIDNNATNWVVLGAHYDCVFVSGLSYGYNDNFSGICGVLTLAEHFVNFPEDFNVLVVFYGAEEVGCFGSNYFIKNLDKNIKDNILLSMNFDSIGGGDNLYYFHSDYSTNYGNAIDKFAENSVIKKTPNKLFALQTVNEINYYNIGFSSDNSSFIKQGTNSITFFAGNLDAFNGLGFFETANHERIMHRTDTIKTNDEIFGEKFVENINSTITFTLDLLTSDGFDNENFAPNQVETFLYSDWFLKIIGVALLGVMFAGYGVFSFVYFKKNKKINNKKQK